MNFEELGSELAKLRKSQKITQQALADAVGISRATLIALEKGRSVDIGVRKVIKLFNFFNQELCFKQQSNLPTFEELKNEK